MGASSNKDAEKSVNSRRGVVATFLVLAILVAGFLGWIYWNRFQDIFQLQEEIEGLKQKRVELKQEISSLEEQLAKRNDISYIEKLAREELGLTYPKRQED